MNHPRKTRLALGLIATLAALTTAALAADPPVEHLVMHPYGGSPTAWKLVTNQPRGGGFLREQIPADQQLETYKDILVAQTLSVRPGQVDPETFLKAMFASTTKACSGVRVTGPKSAVEDGYKVAYAQFYCGRQNGETFGVNMFFKVIAGEGAMYSINRDFRVPPSAVGGSLAFPKEQAAEGLALMKNMGEANDYLADHVYLCGRKSTAARCRG